MVGLGRTGGGPGGLLPASVLIARHVSNTHGVVPVPPVPLDAVTGGFPPATAPTWWAGQLAQSNRGSLRCGSRSMAMARCSSVRTRLRLRPRRCEISGIVCW